MSDKTETEEAAVADLAEEIMRQVPAILAKGGKCLTDVQRQKLASHVHAMARRSLTGETLPEFDKSLFDEVSAGARALSEEVTALFGNLPHEEALLLSIHMETAQSKD